MHVLDDPQGLSPRARAFLRRAGFRRLAGQAVVETRAVGPPPAELTARQEWFSARFGGLRYDVRHRSRVGDWSRESVRRWDFDLAGGVYEDHTGWSFGWYGQLVSSPVSYRVHADGRFGVSSGGPFLEVLPSIYHMIEGHALEDELFDWEPVAPKSLAGWAPGDETNAHLRRHFEALPAIPEASGPCDRWARSDRLAIHLFDQWTAQNPRPQSAMVWSRAGR